MSLEAIATIICDNCGVRLASKPCDRFTYCGRFAGEHKQDLVKTGWLIVSRGRFHSEAHYCPACADKPTKPLKGKPRWKGPEVTEEISNALQPTCTIPNRKVWLLVSGEKCLFIGSQCTFIGESGMLIQWHLRHRKKAVTSESIIGWIGNKELVAILGHQPKT